MPSKDDDDPASTKDVVTKRQKQLLNREEMDLNLIAESLGGVLLEAPNLKSVGSSIFRTIFGNQSGRTKKGSKTVRTGRPPGVGLRQRGAIDQSVTPSGGGSDRGSVGNAASQRQVNPGQTAYKAKSTSTKIPSASGGDAGSAGRARLVAPRTTTAPRTPRRGGFATAAVLQALDQPTRQLGDYLGGQLAKALVSTMSDKDKAKVAQKAPSVVGAQGPDFTPDIAKNIQARDKQASIDYWTSPEVQTQLAQTVARQNQTKTEPKTETEVQKSSTNKVKVAQTTKDKPTQVSPQAVAAPTIAGVLRGTRTGRGRRPSEPRKDKKGKFKISPPGYGGKIGRRTNPQ